MSAGAVSSNEVQLLREENTQLRAQIAWLKQKLFGGGQSEKLDRAQLLLALGELEKLAAASAPAQTITYERTPGPAAPRPLPAETFAHLPVQETVVLEPAAVLADPTLYEKIGEERTFEVDVTPPKLFKREIVRPKYRHRLDRTRAPLVAPAPARVVPGGYASAGLLAWVMIAKYCDHLPLYRQEKMLARWGAAIARQTMTDWVRFAAERLEPLHKRMRQELLAGGYVQVDETPVRCNDPDDRARQRGEGAALSKAKGESSGCPARAASEQKRGGTSQGWLWVVSRPGGDVVFDWRLSRRHNELNSLLPDYRGLLQSDAYGAYPGFVRAREGVTWVGCWAHARRGFHEALAEAPQRAGFVLRLIAHLYQYEREWSEGGPAWRAAQRSGHFGLTLALLYRTARRLAELSLPRSQLGQACTYLLNQWEPLTAHLHHGRTKLDNNSVENAIRPSALGKKNWLFIGHPEAGQRSAIIYSLVVSCQRHGHDPLAYLRDVLGRLPALTNHDDLTPLLPGHWKTPATS
jgi:transposase